MLTERIDKDGETSEKVISYLLQAIIQENLPLSIRYFSEWIVVKLVQKNIMRVVEVDKHFDKAKKLRLACMPSFLACQYFIGLTMPSRLELAMRKIAPWCMSQHFATRVYAHTFMKKLFETGKALSNFDVTQVHKCVDLSFITHHHQIVQVSGESNALLMV